MKQTKLTIFIDGWCPNCKRFAKLIKRIDIWQHIKIEDARQMNKSNYNIDLLVAKKHMASINQSSKVAYGFTSIYRVVKTIPLM